MLRKGWAQPGCLMTGTLSWTSGGEPSGSIGYTADLRDPDHAELRLSYTCGPQGNRESVSQTVRLVSSQPHYGGRRWWMVCPYRHERVGKLYLPNGGDRFAGRKAWRLGYKSQRVANRDKPFERLFALQSRLGCTQGYEQPIRRPKGMWRKTYARLQQRYWDLDAQCGAEMLQIIGLLKGSLQR